MGAKITRPEVSEKSIYDATIGRRKQPPQHLSEREEMEFQNLQKRKVANDEKIKHLQTRLRELAGGRKNLMARGKNGVTHDPSIHNGWSVIPLGTKVRVYCEVGKSLGQKKTNFVR